MYYEEFDGELCITDDVEVKHIYSRESVSRACYYYVSKWIKNNTKPDPENPNNSWEKACEHWHNLSEAEKGEYITIVKMESQNASDLSQGLLANLSMYQGLKNVKTAFEEAIKSVAYSFSVDY